jgi:hypothetical protein
MFGLRLLGLSKMYPKDTSKDLEGEGVEDGCFVR